MDHDEVREGEGDSNFIDLTHGENDYVLAVQFDTGAQMHFEVKGASLDDLLEAVLDAVEHELSVLCHRDEQALLLLPRIPQTAVVQVVSAARWAQLVQEAQEAAEARAAQQRLGLPVAGSGGGVRVPTKVARPR